MCLSPCHPRFLNTDEAAAYLGLHAETLVSWRRNRRGPTYIKLGSKVSYRQEDLDAFLRLSTRRPPNV